MDMTPGDMAEELAEYEYLNGTMQEILERARKAILRDWHQLATNNPRAVADAYFQMIGRQ